MMVGMALNEMDTSGTGIKEFKKLVIDINESTVQWRLKNATLNYMKPFVEIFAQ